MFKKIFNSQTKTVNIAASILIISSFLSAVLGLLRDRLLAQTFGAGIEISIYAAAFRIPDLAYNILIAGGVLVAFLPLFSEYFSQGKDRAWEATNHILNVFLLFLILLSSILFILAPWLINLSVPGFSPEEKSLAVSLTRLLLLSPILFGISNIISGVLQYFNRFLAYALCPILYNLGIIFGILFLSPKFGIFGVGIGVILGAVLHLAIQIPSAIKCGYCYKPLFNFRHPAVQKIFILGFPRMIAMAAGQLNLIIITAIASTISAGSVAIFYYSNNFQSLPVGIIGISFATASFPFMARSLANGQRLEFQNYFSSTFRQIIFLIIPLSLLTFVLRSQIIRIILGTGNFGWEETRLTAACLGLFSFSIISYSLLSFLYRAFFSFQETKTPTLITIAAVVINTVLSFFFVWLLGFQNLFSSFMESSLRLVGVENTAVIGLPLAFSLAAAAQLFLSLIFLYRKIGDFGLKEIWRSLKKILFSSFLMIGFVYLTLYLASRYLNTQTFFGIFLQTAFAVLVGAFVYIAAALVLNSPEIKTIKRWIFRQGQLGSGPAND